MRKKFFGVMCALAIGSSIFYCGNTMSSCYSAVHPIVAEAQGLDDSVSGDSDVSTGSSGLIDMFKNYEPYTEGQLQEASQKMSPVANAAGVLISILLWFALIGMFVMTGFDFVYMAIPPIRKVLYIPDGGGAQGGAGMGGMGYGGMGRMGMGRMGGGQPVKKGRQFVSDEAVQAGILLDQAKGAATGGSGGGMGYGGMGMGMGAQPQMDASELTSKGVLVTYFKARAVFYVMFGLCAVVLTCSALLGLGLNAGMLVIRIVNSVANGITTIF